MSLFEFIGFKHSSMAESAKPHRSSRFIFGTIGVDVLFEIVLR